MELEIVVKVPVGGSTLTIPTRSRVFEDGIGGRVVDSIAVHAVDGLKSVELVDGRLLLELKTGERYQFAVDQLLTGGKDAKLELRETLTTDKPAAFGGFEEKVRLHEMHLAAGVP